MTYTGFILILSSTSVGECPRFCSCLDLCYDNKYLDPECPVICSRTKYWTLRIATRNKIIRRHITKWQIKKSCLTFGKRELMNPYVLSFSEFDPKLKSLNKNGHNAVFGGTKI